MLFFWLILFLHPLQRIFLFLSSQKCFWHLHLPSSLSLPCYHHSSLVLLYIIHCYSMHAKQVILPFVTLTIPQITNLINLNYTENVMWINFICVKSWIVSMLYDFLCRNFIGIERSEIIHIVLLHICSIHKNILSELLRLRIWQRNNWKWYLLMCFHGSVLNDRLQYN